MATERSSTLALKINRRECEKLQKTSRTINCIQDETMPFLLAVSYEFIIIILTQ
jgi:hypothetical protein